MAHFARVDENNIVIQVIAIDNNAINNLNFPTSEPVGQQFIADIGLPGTWMQTSYNKRFRKNYAGRGYVFDQKRNAFIPPRPYESWQLDETTCRWNPPIERPKDGNFYAWDEINKKWAKEDSISGISSTNEPDYELE